MSENVINFAKAKEDADKQNSDLVMTLHVYRAPNSEIWASVENISAECVDASWYTFSADLLRKLAWLADGMAADEGSDIGHPIASVVLFESSRISTRWNDGLVKNISQIEWIRSQMDCGVDAICAAQGETR
jgi:hypothetical protein